MYAVQIENSVGAWSVKVLLLCTCCFVGPVALHACVGSGDQFVTVDCVRERERSLSKARVKMVNSFSVLSISLDYCPSAAAAAAALVVQRRWSPSLPLRYLAGG